MDERVRNPWKGVAVAALLIAGAWMVIAGLFILDDRRDDRELARAVAKNEAATEQIITQRTESRISACEGDREFALAHNRLVEAIAVDRDGDRTPEEQAVVDQLVAPQIVPVRKCDQASIEAYYEGRNR